MEGTKPWYLSKGVWGGVVALLGGLGHTFFGIEWGADLEAQATQLILDFVGVVGGALAIYGRIKATEAID